jgi:type I restriction enzyme, R subunit
VVTISSGTGRLAEPEPEPLSVIISRLNERYGTEWRDADRLVFDAALEDVVNDQSVQVQAVNNSPENFGLVFPQIFTDALLGRMDRNEKVVFRFLDDDELKSDVIKTYVILAQAKAKIAYQQHCPIGELLAAGESAHLEYKSTLRTAASTGEVIKPLETATIKTVAAFANSPDGGTLLIGVADDGSVHGLASDYVSLHKDGKNDRDLFQLHLAQLLINAVGEAVASSVSTQLHTIDGRDLCRVHVPPSSFPVDAHVVLERKGQLQRKTAFFVRIGNGTREITDTRERQRYIAQRWGSLAMDAS